MTLASCNPFLIRKVIVGWVGAVETVRELASGNLLLSVCNQLPHSELILVDFDTHYFQWGSIQADSGGRQLVTLSTQTHSSE